MLVISLRGVLDPGRDKAAEISWGKVGPLILTFIDASSFHIKFVRTKFCLFQPGSYLWLSLRVLGIEFSITSCI